MCFYMLGELAGLGIGLGWADSFLQTRHIIIFFLDCETVVNGFWELHSFKEFHVVVDHIWAIIWAMYENLSNFRHIIEIIWVS